VGVSSGALAASQLEVGAGQSWEVEL